ncbi:MAG: lysophospholipase [Planctomycetota bacterium]|nr:lysophospholipase [Planctomycetota bacterium]
MPTNAMIHAADGTELKATYFPGTAPRGVLVISHGLGEHAGCYDELAETLSSTPGLVDVLSFDFRGHGHSPGKRGVIARYDDFVTDLGAAITWASAQRPDLPRFVLGHSNGGQVALHAALKNDPEIDGLILSNPSLRISAKVPRHKYYAGLFLRKFAPGVTLTSTVADEHLTRDPVNLAERKGDLLRHGKISAPLFFGMVEGGEHLVTRASAIHVPVLMLIGGSDPVVDPATTLDFFERLGSPDKTLRLYADMLHEPLNEIGREEVVQEILGWLERQLNPKVEVAK